jgi:hypothetical protein
MGPLTLKGLGPGKFRMLTPKEVKQLYQLASGEKKPIGRPEQKSDNSLI